MRPSRQKCGARVCGDSNEVTRRSAALPAEMRDCPVVMGCADQELDGRRGGYRQNAALQQAGITSGPSAFTHGDSNGQLTDCGCRGRGFNLSRQP